MQINKGLVLSCTYQYWAGSWRYRWMEEREKGESEGKENSEVCSFIYLVFCSQVPQLQPCQRGNQNATSNIKIKPRLSLPCENSIWSWAWWHRPVTPATWEAETGDPQVHELWATQWVQNQPGQFSKTLSQNEKKTVDIDPWLGSCLTGTEPEAQS